MTRVTWNYLTRRHFSSEYISERALCNFLKDSQYGWWMILQFLFRPPLIRQIGKLPPPSFHFLLHISEYHSGFLSEEGNTSIMRRKIIILRKYRISDKLLSRLFLIRRLDTYFIRSIRESYIEINRKCVNPILKVKSRVRFIDRCRCYSLSVHLIIYCFNVAISILSFSTVTKWFRAFRTLSHICILLSWIYFLF